MFHSPYLRCPACRILLYDPGDKLGRLAEPAPCCGARGETRESWPGLQAIKLLEIAEGQDTDKPEGTRIGVLFFASAFEVMLEDILVELLRQHTASEGLCEAVLDGYQGIERRRTLFGRLSGTALGDVLKADWGQEFLRDWSTLTAQRNKIAHGSYYFRGSEDVELIRRLRTNFLRSFAEMHNHVTRRAAV
jgi:hypothetical protein